MKQHRGNRQVAVLAALLEMLLAGAAGGAYAGEGRSNRLAVWGFRSAADDAEGASLGERLATLVEVELARRGAEVVERRGFESTLQEHKLAFTQFADARKAVRAGKLVRADVVLVGSVLRQGKKRAVTMKAVETVSGKVLDARAGALSEGGLKRSAADAAAFIMAARRREIGKRVFVAVGGFEDLSMGDKFTALGREVRARLVQSLSRNADAALVEREHVEPLLLELGLSRSGLAAADFGATDADPAFLIVDGLYRSYSEGEVRLRVNLRLERVGEPLEVVQVDTLPGNAVHEGVRKATLAFLSRPRVRARLTRTAAQEAAAKAHLERGIQQSRINMRRKPELSVYGSLGGATWSGTDPKRRKNIDNAVSSFESAILLDPANGKAKLLLAVCLADPEVREFRRARRILEQIIAGSHDAGLRQLAALWLGRTYIQALRKVPNLTPSASPEMRAGYRQAIGIWLKLADSVESPAFRMRVLTEATLNLGWLRQCKLASREECWALAERCIDTRCRMLVNRAPKDRDHAPVFELQTYWGRIYGHRDAASFEHSVKLAARFAKQYPPLEHLLYFGLLCVVSDNYKPTLVPKVLAPLFGRSGELIGMASCCHDMLPRLACITAKQGGWEDAVRLCEMMAAYHAKRYPKAPPLPAVEVMRARCLREMGRAREALAIYEKLGDIEVDTSYYSFLGNKVAVAAEIALCRRSLGKKARPRSERAALGAPVVSLPDGKREGRVNTPSVVTALAAVGRYLWIGCAPESATYARSRWKDPAKMWGRKGGLHRFDKATGRLDAIDLDASAESRWITCLEPQRTDLWVGTFGGGLYRFNTRTRSKKRWTQDDGLPKNHVSTLCLARPSELWVGFGFKSLGGCGRLETRSGKFFGMVPRLGPGDTRPPSQWGPFKHTPRDSAPARSVSAIRSSADRWVWVAVHNKGLQRWDARARTWDTATHNTDFSTNPRKYGGPISSKSHHLSSLAVGDGFVAVGAGYGIQSYGGTVDIYHYKQATWSHVSLKHGLPAGNIQSLAASGRTLWIGGRKYPRRHAGTFVSDCYVASYDLATKRLSRIYAASSGDRSPVLLADGKTLWVGVGSAVYRIRTR